MRIYIQNSGIQFLHLCTLQQILQEKANSMYWSNTITALALLEIANESLPTF